MQFDLVSPERSVASRQAESVEVPGADGDMTVMADHASLVTTLRPGIIRANSPDTTDEFVVTGGFVEISEDGISILAEQAVPISEASPAMVDAIISREMEDIKTLEGARRDSADTRIACLKELSARLG